MTNRKNWFVMVLCIFGLIVTGCGTISKAGTIYDESVPLEQSSWIHVNQVGKVTEYNGITVNWPRERVIQIPAGNTSFKFDLYAIIFTGHGDRLIKNSGARLQGTGALFQYNFQPGKIYSLLVGESDNGQYGLAVYAWNFGETVKMVLEIPADEKNYVEFVLFLNQFNPSSATPRVLN